MQRQWTAKKNMHLFGELPHCKFCATKTREHLIALAFRMPHQLCDALARQFEDAAFLNSLSLLVKKCAVGTKHRGFAGTAYEAWRTMADSESEYVHNSSRRRKASTCSIERFVRDRMLAALKFFFFLNPHHPAPPTLEHFSSNADPPRMRVGAASGVTSTHKQDTCRLISFHVRRLKGGGLAWVLLPLLRRSRKHLRCDSVA